MDEDLARRVTESKDELDDYMTMAIPENPKTETVLQRRARIDPKERGWHKPKAEIEAERQLAAEEALRTPIESSNKGRIMLAKMGFKGGKLGQVKGQEDGLLEPIQVHGKQGRAGLGIDERRKREAEEAFAAGLAKRHKTEQDFEDFRAQAGNKQKVEHLEIEVRKAMEVAERLFQRQQEDENERGSSEPSLTEHPDRIPLKSVNLLWRRLELDRRIEPLKSEWRRGSGDLDEMLVLLTSDPELDEFEALGPDKRLEKLVSFMRGNYNYCYWCGIEYEDATDMDTSCPGPEEEQH